MVSGGACLLQSVDCCHGPLLCVVALSSLEHLTYPLKCEGRLCIVLAEEGLQVIELRVERTQLIGAVAFL